ETEKARNKRGRNLKRLRKKIIVMAAKHRQRKGCTIIDSRTGEERRVNVLVIVQEGVELALVEADLHELGTPDNVFVAHFYALRAMNSFKGVTCVIAIGRPMPKIALLEALTETHRFDDINVKSIERMKVDGKGLPIEQHMVDVQLPMTKNRVCTVSRESHK